MASLPLEMDGFKLARKGNVTSYIRKEDFDLISGALLDSEHCEFVERGGRGALQRFPLGDGFGLIRKYRRGGWLRHWVKESYLTNRPLHEFKVHREAAKRGVPVAELLGVTFHRAGPCYRGAFATFEIQGNHLLGLLKERHADAERALADAGRAVYFMHDKGIDHADLQLLNLFWDGWQIVILDFDKARVSDRLNDAQREQNLARLLRSFEKHGFDEEFALFRAAYGNSSG